MPIVLVEISPPGSPPALAHALADACSSAVRDGACKLEGEPTAEPDAIAIVRWDDAEERHARVQVGQRRKGDPDWQTKTLDFQESDSRVERWQSVGLTVATLAGDMTAIPAPASDEPRPDSAAPRDVPSTLGPPLPPAPAPEATTFKTHDTASNRGARRLPEPARVWVGAGAAVGTGLDPGGPRFGGRADVGWRPSMLPVFARLAVGFDVRPSNSLGLSAQWETVTLGAGAILDSGPFMLEPRLGFGWAHIRAAVVDPTTRQSEAGGRSAWTIDAGADGVLRTGKIGFVVGFDGWRASAATQVVVKNQPVATDGATGWSGTVGARFFIP